jgi:methionine sulfoxide reductase heme-binding subunit
LNEHVFWYAARATGIVGWVLLTASVLWGLALSTRVLGRQPRPGWMLDIHRYLGGSAVIYTALHIASLWADSFVHFSASDLFVPMASSWRPGAIAWGIAVMYLLVAVEITSLLKRRIPTRIWRAVHVSSLAALAATWVHAFSAGSDMGSPIARWFAIGSEVTVLFLLAYKGLIRLRMPDLGRAPSGASA